MIEQLNEWAVKVRAQKKELDQRMFDDMMKITRDKLTREGYAPTREWLKKNALIIDNRVGPILLAQNGKLIMDKLWSLNQKKTAIIGVDYAKGKDVTVVNGKPIAQSNGSGKVAGKNVEVPRTPRSLSQPVTPESPEVKK
jgi:hypothetical protein